MATGLKPLAAGANLHAAISWMPYFEKSKWQTILPEVDPYKFTSFPMRASWEIYKLSGRTHEQLGKPGNIARLPPILTFQSVADKTVGASAIVTELYEKLPANGSELVLYDVNRNSTVLHLIKNLQNDPADDFMSAAPLKFGVTILQNRDQHGPDLDTFSLLAGQIRPVVATTGYSWPAEVYSLSHVAVPFPGDDPIYGNGSGRNEDDPGFAFGELSPRGEQGVLRLSPAYFLRMRYNPFIGFQERFLLEWLEGL